MNDLNIPYEDLAKANSIFSEELKNATARVIEKGWYVLGNEVKDFEKEFAQFQGQGTCVGVASGLDALVIALRLLNLPHNAEVIVPSNTYIATILAVLQLGLKPVLVEPDIRTYNIDPVKIKDAITPNTGAIIVVHLYGKACEMDKIMQIAGKHGLPIIEDCAQSHGAKFKGKLTGNFGIGAFSFYPTKNLGALGDAGAITLARQEYDAEARMIRNYGSKVKYYNEVVGLNSRLDEIQAAMLRVKLKFLNQITEHKRGLADVYFEELCNVKDVVLPVLGSDFFDVYHIFNIRTEHRDELKKYLIEKGVGTEVHYPVPPHLQKAMEGKFEGKSFAISEEIHRTTLSLPISFAHTKTEVRIVASLIKQFF